MVPADLETVAGGLPKTGHGLAQFGGIGSGSVHETPMGEGDGDGEGAGVGVGEGTEPRFTVTVSDAADLAVTDIWVPVKGSVNVLPTGTHGCPVPP